MPANATNLPPLPALDKLPPDSSSEESDDRDYDEGRDHLKHGELHEAILSFSRALRRDPKDALAYLKRGTAYAALDEDKDALADFSKVIELEPKNTKAYLYRAYVHAHLKEPARTVADCSDAIRLQPEDADAHLCRGQAHDQLKEYAKAHDDFRAAVKLAPSSASAHNALAWLMATSPDESVRDGKQAIEMGKRACELSAWNNAQIIDTLAAAYAECGQFDEALKWQQKAVDLASDKDREELRTRVDVYKKRQPYRQP